MNISYKALKDFLCSKAGFFFIGFTLVYLTLVFIRVEWGQFIGDEGWYCLGVRNVMEGMKPYQDFLFYQMPVTLYIYAIWFKLVGVSIEAGRIFSALLGLGGLWFALLTCYRRAGFEALVIAGIMLALNFNYAFDMGIFQTQPITVFFTSVVIYILSEKYFRSALWQMGLATAFMILALYCRQSLLPSIVMLGFYCLWKCRSRIRSAMMLMLAGAVVTVLIFLYFYSDGNFIFSTLTVHSEFFGNPPWTMERLEGVVKTWICNELPIILCMMLCFVYLAIRLFKEGVRQVFEDDNYQFEFFLASSYVLVTTIHWINVQSHAKHQTSLIIYAVVLSATIIGRWLAKHDLNTRRWLLSAFTVLALLGSIYQEWVVYLDGWGSLGKLNETIAVIQRYSKPGDSLLSFNAELAVDSGLKVPHGYEMSEFTYFPMMDDLRAKKLNVTNLNKLRHDIASGEARIFCVGDREFYMMCRGNAQLAKYLKDDIDKYYQQVWGTDKYGQFFGTMYVYVRK